MKLLDESVTGVYAIAVTPFTADGASPLPLLRFQCLE